LARDLTVSQAAEETGSTLNSTYARVQRYLRLGLLKVVREVQRGGRAVKVYRPIADELAIHPDFSLEAHLRWHTFWERQIYLGVKPHLHRKIFGQQPPLPQ